MPRDTIIGFPVETQHALRSLLMDGAELAPGPDADGIGKRLLKIRAASSAGMRSSASILVHRMYASRGYHSSSVAEGQNANRITLTASDADAVVGTITVGFDSADGLLVDDLFADEIADLRFEGLRLCEFTKLAMDSVVRSKRILASLFHVAYIYAHRIKNFDNLLIEVNPRHVRYYENMLGFVTRGPVRLNRRVNAPAVLLNLDFNHAHRQIDRYGGRPEAAAQERSLYPYFFPADEAAGILSRLTER